MSDKKMLSTTEVANIFQRDKRTIQRWFHEGVFPNAYKLSERMIVIPAEDVDAELKRRGDKTSDK